ncbi:hypothetical protein TrCOL_g8479 [Triparma columacea]|uniref:Ribosome biogenesis regulatory protein n=1 Tax=Triparma columacea TaxID=722753 RepID=A0A9W7G0W9_9STRA|nr:hypothetical protein TrCOL_g8479 [Triparma columacea]
MTLKATQIAPNTFNASKDNEVLEDARYDLYNLAAFNDFAQRSDDIGDSSTSDTTADGMNAALETFLLNKATEGTSQLIGALWTLETKASDVGPLALLPSSRGDAEVSVSNNAPTLLPRAKPAPKPKEPTKWELFRKEKGIETRKRGRKEWDEATGEWKVRYGMGSAANANGEWPIMEAVQGNEYADPWQAKRDERKEKVEKNQVQKTRNMERQGLVQKGSAKKLEKQFEENRKKIKLTAPPLPAGLPVDMKSTKGSEVKNRAARGLESTKKALAATRLSTASMGKFDQVRKGEDKVRKKRSGEEIRDRRKELQSANQGGAKGEADRGLKVLNSVLLGSEKKEKMRRTGKMHKGETGHDFDYDDGLGGGSFRKKKGRAGAGKLKKVTKKNIK